MTISSTAPTVTAAGISVPTFAQVLDYLTSQYKTIYGSDIYLGSDSQDGQFLGILATAINDANSAAVAVYNAFSPATAAGNSLSSAVAINGMQRAVPTNSTVSLTLTGTAGTVITNGIAQDTAKNNWALPATTTIGGGGTVTVTATAANAGAVTALTGTVSTILTPTQGWQTVNNASATTVGAAVESDGALRTRQAVTVASPAQSPLVTVIGAVAAVSGVTRFSGLENPTNSTDGNGIPAHSLSMVVEGGSAAAIATAIANNKTIGANTYGSTSEVVTTLFGVSETINFYVVAPLRIVVDVSVHAISGYTSAIGVEVQTAIAAYLNALSIGSSVKYTRLYGPANLNGSADGLTYEVTALTVGLFGGGQGTTDIAVAFNQVASGAVADVVLTLV